MSFYTNREVVSLGLRLQNVVHRLCDGDVLGVQEVCIRVHRHADLAVAEPVLRCLGAHDALQQRRLGVVIPTPIPEHRSAKY